MFGVPAPGPGEVLAPGSVQGADRWAVRVHPSLLGGHGALHSVAGRVGRRRMKHKARLVTRANGLFEGLSLRRDLVLND
ncbi:hypothetical protein GCM10022242_01760 [Nocardioides panacisoli]|uniref:Uncharacterized protein n=1 Tax=Nocardioides panacisoli TaxID=627624 RepID=A0ABP7HRF7_9ACTN